MEFLAGNLAPFIASAEKGEEHVGFVGILTYAIFVLIVIFCLMAYAKKGMNLRVFKNPILNCFEQLYLFIEKMCVGTIGSHGRKYVSILMTFWMVIFASNVCSLFFPAAPTADVGFNLGMALIAIGYVQYEGIKTNGFFGHLRHFGGPNLGNVLLAILINPLIFLIEIVSEVLKNVSLSLRLYGNIEGGHLAASAMNKLGEGIYVPFGAFLIPIKLLTCVVQALIFTLLLSVYISLVTHHDEPEVDHESADEKERWESGKIAEAMIH